MEVEPRLASKLEKAIGMENPLRKSLYVLGIITEAIESLGLKPILVGGGAVEFYTLGGYSTKDLDLIVNDREQVKGVLAELGFIRNLGLRHWYHPELDIALEIPDEFLAGSLDRVLAVEIGEMEVFVIGIEDLIIDRLTTSNLWDSEADEEWACKLMMVHYDEIDWDYLKERAEKDHLEDAVALTRAKAENLPNLIPE